MDSRNRKQPEHKCCNVDFPQYMAYNTDSFNIVILCKKEVITMRKMIVSIVAIVSIAGIAITALAISERY